MLRTVIRSLVVIVVFAVGLLAAAPAFAQQLAQDAESSARPWHYWIAPFLLGGALLLVAAVGVGYYLRVMGGRRR